MKKLTHLILIALTIISCSTEETLTPSTNFNADEFKKSEEANKIAEEVNSIITKDYEEDANNKSASMSVPYLPDCVTRTYTTNGTTHEVEFDFGTIGCTMPNGNVITGKIHYSYTGDLTAETKTITYTLINFTFNSIDVEGSDEIYHIRNNTNGNPQSTIVVDFTLTWPSGLVGYRTGSIIREWIEGSDTLLDWTDDVFSISGNWTTTFDNGSSYSATIATNLRRELSCWYFVSGSINFNYNGLLFTGDYGDGACDNNATLTFQNGNTINILL